MLGEIENRVVLQDGVQHSIPDDKTFEVHAFISFDIQLSCDVGQKMPGVGFTCDIKIPSL